MKKLIIDIFIIKFSKIPNAVLTIFFFCIIFGIIGVLSYIFKYNIFLFFKTIFEFIVWLLHWLLNHWYVVIGYLSIVYNCEIRDRSCSIFKEFNFNDRQKRLYIFWAVCLIIVSWIISNYEFVFVYKFSLNKYITFPDNLEFLTNEENFLEHILNLLKLIHLTTTTVVSLFCACSYKEEL